MLKTLSVLTLEGLRGTGEGVRKAGGLWVPRVVETFISSLGTRDIPFQKAVESAFEDPVQ